MQAWLKKVLNRWLEASLLFLGSYILLFLRWWLLTFSWVTSPLWKSLSFWKKVLNGWLETESSGCGYVEPHCPLLDLMSEVKGPPVSDWILSNSSPCCLFSALSHESEYPLKVTVEYIDIYIYFGNIFINSLFKSSVTFGALNSQLPQICKKL